MRGLIIGVTGLCLVACSQSTTPTNVSAKAAFEAYVTALNEGDTATAANYYDTEDGWKIAGGQTGPGLSE